MKRQALSYYPTKAQITRALESAREFGIDVSGFEVTRDGTIRIVERAASSSVEDEITQWEKAGKLA